MKSPIAPIEAEGAGRSTWRIGTTVARELAGKTTRAAILETIARLEERGSEPDADPMYRRIIGYQHEILAARGELDRKMSHQP